MHNILRPLCNSPDKTLYDVTFSRRFWRGKQMIANKLGYVLLYWLAVITKSL